AWHFGQSSRGPASSVPERPQRRIWTRASGIRSPEDVDGAGDSRAAEIVGQPDGGVLHLVGVLSAQLQRSLVELAHAGRAHRMPLGEQAAAGVDGDLAAY